MSPGGTDMPPVGSRVRVLVSASGERPWCRDAAESMCGSFGTVTRHRKDDAVVEFDEPCKPWFLGQLPIKAWGFVASEMYVLELGTCAADACKNKVERCSTRRCNNPLEFADDDLCGPCSEVAP